MEEKYIVISRNEDEPRLEIYTKSELEKALNDGDFLGYEFVEAEDISGDLDNFPGKTAVFFKSTEFKPNAVEKVTAYQVP